MHRLPLPASPHGGVPPTRPTRPANPYQLIAAELRAAILDDTLRSGTVLPAMKQLAAQHHVAVSTIHRAIALLAAEGLVTVSRGRRATITPTPTPPSDQPLSATAQGVIDKPPGQAIATARAVRRWRHIKGHRLERRGSHQNP